MGLLIALATAALGQASGQATPHTRLNSVDAFVEYSNNSSHIELGQARNRRLLAFGFGYSRRLLLRRTLDLQYRAEIRPALFVSDPVVQETFVYTATAYNPQGPGVFRSTQSYRQAAPCVSGPVSSYTGKDKQGNITYTETISAACGREWTPGQAISPAGIKLNLLPRRRLQPVLTALGGYMFSTHAIPIDTAGSYNFTFEYGAGLEIYRSRRATSLDGQTFLADRSLRLEYRVHHISNKKTADDNPGIDNGVLQLTYAFGH